MTIRNTSDSLLLHDVDQSHVLDLLRWEDDGGAASSQFSCSDGDQPDKLVGSGDVRFAPTAGKLLFSLNRKASPLSKPVYKALADHQISEADWEYSPLSALLHEWSDRFNDRFRLHLPKSPLRLDPDIRGNCAGYFLPGHNELGLVYEIAVRVPRPAELADLDLGDTLGTLLHEQLHLLQELTGIAGRNNYHNVQYRATAERFGLLVDHRGHQTYERGSPFLDLLAEFGVAPPRPLQLVKMEAGFISPSQGTSKAPGRSKLQKWSCGCTNVRVGVSILYARCTRPGCGKPYVLS